MLRDGGFCCVHGPLASGSNSLVGGSWNVRSWSSVGWQSWKRGGYPELPTCLGPWMLQFCLGPSNYARVRIRVSDLKKYHQTNEIYRRQLPNCFVKVAHIFTNSDGKNCRFKTHPCRAPFLVLQVLHGFACLFQRSFEGQHYELRNSARLLF